MTRHAPRFLYMLLFLWIGISMAYYVAGVAALNEKWFHGERHGCPWFYLDDDETIHGLDKEAREAGLAEGDVLETLNGRPFTGDFQSTNYFTYSKPRDVVHVSSRGRNGEVKSAPIHLKPWPSQNFSLGVHRVSDSNFRRDAAQSGGRLLGGGRAAERPQRLAGFNHTD